MQLERQSDLAYGDRAASMRPCRRKPKAKNPRGLEGQSPLIPLSDTKENQETRVRFFGGTTCTISIESGDTPEAIEMLRAGRIELACKNS
jgi:hypothetical protein